ncbi:MAG TPA: hypothetical protein VKU89_05730 [Solirubrobacteraceae bacterium]|nr:hypothetical protein [Solirubrobacteraceae bacterium]
MEAAERVRTLADWGLQALIDSEAHEERRLDAQGHTNSADRRAALDAARERAELARAERANQLVEHNAMTLVSMVGALDALVEELVPRAREMLVEHQAQALIDQARGQEPEATARVGDAGLEAIRVAVQKVLNERLGSFDSSPRGTGAKRWEDMLRHAGLQAQPERPIPSDLDQALTEVVALRHVLAHRAGRVDARALAQAPSLRYADGDLVRVTHADYLVYSAALWTYGEEVVRRLLGELAPAPPLADWRQNHTFNA